MFSAALSLMLLFAPSAPLAESLCDLGRNALLGGEWRSAATAYAAAAWADPKRLDLALAAAGTAGLVRWHAAAPTANRFVSKLKLPEGKDRDSFLARARLRLESGGYEAGLVEVNDALAFDEKHAPSWVMRGRLYLGLGEYGDALFCAKQASALDPSDWRAALLEGTSLWHLRDMQGVDRFRERILSLNPAPDVLYNELARLYFKANKPDMAMSYINKTLQLNPKDFDALLMRGIVRNEMANWRSALADLEACVEVKPENTIALAWLAITRFDMGDHSRAVQEYDRLLELAPTDAESWSKRGLAQAKLGQREAAVASLSRAIALSPGVASPLTDRGIQRYRSLRMRDALADFDRSLRFAPLDATIHDWRSLALAGLGRFKEARAEMDIVQRLRKLKPPAKMPDSARPTGPIGP